MTYDTINDAVTRAGGAGALLANRYRIVRQLGQGGMGSVWLAEDTQLDNKPFAIKMLPAILVSNKRAYRQLKDEALVAMKLTHPNIVTLRAFEENNGNPFLVMDYIDGQTLDDYLAEHALPLGEAASRRFGSAPLGEAAFRRFTGATGVSPVASGLPESDVLRILRPIAAALDYAHAEGVVHRDVKPANVMIRKDGHPFILDFGIAREIQETLTRVTGKLSSGTLLYMSPEQLMGEYPKPAQDIYSFAAMAYECLKGEPPFSHGQIEFQIMNKPPAPFTTDALTGKAAILAAGVMAGLAKKPEDRPLSCSAVLGSADSNRVERMGDDAGRAVSMKPPSVPCSRSLGEEDAARARVEAKMMQVRLKRLSDADGFAERKALLAETFLKAEMFFESRLWSDAVSQFASYAKAVEELEKRAEEIAKEIEEAKKVAEERALREAAERAEEEERRRIGPPSGTVKTLTLPGGVEMRLRWCRPGTFMMGSPSTEVGRCNDETQHQVTLTRGFWIGETPVTQKQWERVMGNNPSQFKGADRPVENVSWYDCQAFIKNVSKAAKCDMRLPTEAEWEYACRAGMTGPYGGTGNLDAMGWHEGNKTSRQSKIFFGLVPVTREDGTHAVGEKEPNAWGLYDMHGNVWEWCADWYGDISELKNVKDPKGPAVGVDRVLRGGGWNTLARHCRSAGRFNINPAYRNHNYGFRLCSSVESRLGEPSVAKGNKRVTLAHNKVQLWAGGPYWAETNIGAEKPWDYGCYFWWGGTVGYKRENNAWVASDGSSSGFAFNEKNTPTYSDSIADLYNEGWIVLGEEKERDSLAGKLFGLKERADSALTPEHDAAQVQWGGDWRMPTRQELVDLCDKCDWTLTTMHGVNGYVVCGKGDYASAKIFLPAAGGGDGLSFDSAGSYGIYWSSVPNSDNSETWILHVDSESDLYGVFDDQRHLGRSIRPVQGFTK